MGITLIGWLIGRSTVTPLSNTSLPWIIFIMTWIKGQCVIDYFMALRHAPRRFRLLISGWLLLVLVSIGVIISQS